MENSRLLSKTPPFFNWVKGVCATLGGLSLTLSQTLANDGCLFDVCPLLSESNLVVFSIILGAIAGTSQLAKKEDAKN